MMERDRRMTPEAFADFMAGWDAALAAVTKHAIERAHLWLEHTQEPNVPPGGVEAIQRGLIILRAFIETDVRALGSDRQDIPTLDADRPPKGMQH